MLYRFHPYFQEISLFEDDATTMATTTSTDIPGNNGGKNAPYADVTINIGIREKELETKKINEMKELLKTLQEEACSFKADPLDVKFPDMQITDLLQVFNETGGTLVRVVTDPSAFVARYYSSEDMKQLKKSFKVGSLKKRLNETLITEKLSKRNFTKWEMTAELDEKSYKRGLSMFAKGKKAQDEAGISTSDTDQCSTQRPRNLLRNTQDKDQAIQRLKKDISEKCNLLEKLSTEKAMIECTSRRNMERMASNIVFDKTETSQAVKEDDQPHTRQGTESSSKQQSKQSVKQKVAESPKTSQAGKEDDQPHTRLGTESSAKQQSKKSVKRKVAKFPKTSQAGKEDDQPHTRQGTESSAKQQSKKSVKRKVTESPTSLRKKSVKELKALALKRHIDISACIEKEDLVDVLQSYGTSSVPKQAKRAKIRKTTAGTSSVKDQTDANIAKTETPVKPEIKVEHRFEETSVKPVIKVDHSFEEIPSRPENRLKRSLSDILAEAKALVKDK